MENILDSIKNLTDEQLNQLKIFADENEMIGLSTAIYVYFYKLNKAAKGEE